MINLLIMALCPLSADLHHIDLLTQLRSSVLYTSLSEGTDPFHDIQLGPFTKIFFSFLFIFCSWNIVADFWSKM